MAASRAPALLTPVLPCVDKRDPGAAVATPAACAANSRGSRSGTGTVSSVCESNTAPTALLPMLERRGVSLDDDLLGVSAALEDERDLAARGRVDRDALDDLGLEPVADRR